MMPYLKAVLINLADIIKLDGFLLVFIVNFEAQRCEVTIFQRIAMFDGRYPVVKRHPLCVLKQALVRNRLSLNALNV